MAYRATPLENGSSPSELLMGRRINTTLPVAKTQLQPYSVNKKVLESKEERRMEGYKKNYDKHHGVRNLDELDPEPESEDDFDVTGYQHFPVDTYPGCSPLMSSHQSPKAYSQRASSYTEASPVPYVTRSDRTSRPPEKFDL
ncbi:hypothetical protein AVEN_214300-1 [Araneus ventricosus]|uniref:Uncharacterized protein n=1 Tax=Araneus ventricosus TaxID=182803 RepID=A0A4Y2J898_ARAVE|nr:hypothetical protein AVEN_214300-1 [Araneus ventricosus]